MLPDSPQVREVYAGPDGAFEALRPGWLAIDMSSIAPSTARELAERAAAGGAEMLDAPVSGGDKGAIAGTLSIMVGGSIEKRTSTDAATPRGEIVYPSPANGTNLTQNEYGVVVRTDPTVSEVWYHLDDASAADAGRFVGLQVTVAFVPK